MKTIKSFILLIIFLFAAGCEQEVIDLKDPTTPEEPTPDAGTADFSKYVAIGTSLSAGFQAAALFTDGQNESVGAILAEQFATVNSNAAFVQPAINSSNGFSSSFSNVAGGVFRGRLVLFDPDGAGPRSAGPSPSGSVESTNTCTGVVTPAIPAPYNTAQNIGEVLTPVTGNFNNFSVPGIVLAQILTPATGGPTSSNPAFNPYYRRFASNPSNDGATGSTILGDALGAAPTFFTFEFGYNDVLGYATSGGVGTVAITPGASFNGYLGSAINTILGSNANLKGAIANVPDVTTLPFFKLVAWNSIAFTAASQATIDATNGAYAAYNGGLDAAFGGGAISAAERDKRKISFEVGKNGVVLTDKTLTNLTGLGLPSIRQATAEDLLTLSAGSVLGTLADCANPSSVIGVGVALADQYVLLPSEITAIRDAVTSYNASIAAIVAANPTRLALADWNAAYQTMVTNGVVSVDGVLLTPAIAPPNAAISEDAVHPNGRGAAYFANVFIDAINETFDAAIPKAKVNTYKGTRLPVNP